jgi:hypothetical protein
VARIRAKRGLCGGSATRGDAKGLRPARGAGLRWRVIACAGWPELSRSGRRSSPGACTSADHDGYLFRFSYASGAPVDVYLHTKTCDHLGFNNGAVTGYVSAEFLANTLQFTPGKLWDVAGAAIK